MRLAAVLIRLEMGRQRDEMDVEEKVKGRKGSFTIARTD